MMRTGYLRYLFIPLLATSMAFSAEDNSSEAETLASNAGFIEVRPIDTPKPVYPSRALQRGLEGWVLVSFAITDEGKVIDPVILDSTPPNEFDEAALNAVAEFQFDPASANGTPIEISDVCYLFRFTLDQDAATGAGRPFVLKWRKINDLLDEGKTEGVERLLIDLRTNETRNLYETSWYWWLDARYAQLIDDFDRQRNSIDKSIAPGDQYLPPELYVLAMHTAFFLSVNKYEFGKAISLLTELEKSELAKNSVLFAQTVASLQEAKTRLDSLIRGPGTISVQARISERGFSLHKLVRHAFSLVNVDGNVGGIEIRCNNTRAREFSFSEGLTWNIPESWEGCNTYITGEPGTTFQLLEYPLPDNGANE